MRSASALLISLWTVLIALPASADECWALTNVHGYSALSEENYEFSPDKFSKPMVLCFTASGGTVTGSDVEFVKLGASTLMGAGGNNRGNEVVEIYQIDRKKGKLLYAKGRIGSSTVLPGLSDVVSAFVGDAVRIDK